MEEVEAGGYVQGESSQGFHGGGWDGIQNDLTVLWLLFWVSEECVRQG